MGNFPICIPANPCTVVDTSDLSGLGENSVFLCEFSPSFLSVLQNLRSYSLKINLVDDGGIRDLSTHKVVGRIAKLDYVLRNKFHGPSF